MVGARTSFASLLWKVLRAPVLLGVRLMPRLRRSYDVCSLLPSLCGILVQQARIL